MKNRSPDAMRLGSCKGASNSESCPAAIAERSRHGLHHIPDESMMMGLPWPPKSKVDLLPVGRRLQIEEVLRLILRCRRSTPSRHASCRGCRASRPRRSAAASWVCAACLVSSSTVAGKSARWGGSRLSAFVSPSSSHRRGSGRHRVITTGIRVAVYEFAHRHRHNNKCRRRCPRGPCSPRLVPDAHVFSLRLVVAAPLRSKLYAGIFIFETSGYGWPEAASRAPYRFSILSWSACPLQR